MTDEPKSSGEDIDRAPAIAIFLSAESFMRAALHAHQAADAKTLRLSFEVPIYYLYSHAIELTLKAYLRAKGVTSAELKKTQKWGHDLFKLWNGCFRLGLVLDPVAQAAAAPVVKLLTPFAASYEFRYVKTGCKTLPTLDAVRTAVETLQFAIRPTVVATVGKPIPERG